MVVRLTLDRPLTVDQAKQRIARRLPPGVTLQGKVVFLTDFTVRRSGAVGVAVKVETCPSTTEVRLYGLSPGFGYRLVKRFVLWAFLGRKWSRMEQEVAGWLADQPVWAPPQAWAQPRAPPAPARPVQVPARPAPAPARPAPVPARQPVAPPAQARKPVTPPQGPQAPQRKP